MKLIIYLLALVLVEAAPPESISTESSLTSTGPTTSTEAAPPESISTESSLTSTRPITSTETEEVLPHISSPMGTFRKGFATYERRINIFIENMRRTYMTMYSDNMKFTDEVGKYQDQLPTNKTILVTQKYRERCYCDGQSWFPCPKRCMDSCYFQSRYGGYHRRDNCTNDIQTIRDCWCYDGSTVRCNGGEIDNCYEWKTVEKPVEQPCVEFSQNRTIIDMSHTRFAELLTEPFKKLVRDLDFQLAHLKQAVVATDILSSLTLQMCADQSETQCLPEATELLAKKLTYFKQLQRNLTLEMIKTQDQAEKVSKNLKNLKEQTFTQMTRAIKGYTCCLKGLSFTVTDNECNTTTADSTAVTNSTVPKEAEQSAVLTLSSTKPQQCLAGGNFLCDNQRCIPDRLQCDGEDDCGDGSDEANC